MVYYILSKDSDFLVLEANFDTSSISILQEMAPFCFDFLLDLCIDSRMKCSKQENRRKDRVSK